MNECFLLSDKYTQEKEKKAIFKMHKNILFISNLLGIGYSKFTSVTSVFIHFFLALVTSHEADYNSTLISD